MQRRIGNGVPETVGKYTIQKETSGFAITKDAATPGAPDLVHDTGFSFKISDLQKDGKIGDAAGEYVYFVTEEKVSGYRDAEYRNPSTPSAEGEISWTKSTEYALNNGIIINKPEDSVELPSTGGSGTTLFTLLGAMLLFIAGVGLIATRRRGRYSVPDHWS